MTDAEFAVFCEAVASVMDARDGDCRRLERRLDAETATDAEVLYWAVLQSGLLKGPAHRPRQACVEIRNHLHERFGSLALAALGPQKGRRRRLPNGETPLAVFERWLADPDSL